MKFRPTKIAGAFLVEMQKHEDERGCFARAWCREEFAQAGLRDELVQCSFSFNHRRGTLRGMHYQAAPFAETKLVRCTRGRLFDVILDLRDDSPTFGKSFGAELSAENRRQLWVPTGFAHGFAVLSDFADFAYKVTGPYSPKDERVLRWNDPRISIDWKIDPATAILSERDANAPGLAEL